MRASNERIGRDLADDIHLRARQMQGRACGERAKSQLRNALVARDEGVDVGDLGPGRIRCVIAQVAEAAARADQCGFASGRCQCGARGAALPIGSIRVTCVPGQRAATGRAFRNANLVAERFEKKPRRSVRVAIVDTRDTAAE